MSKAGMGAGSAAVMTFLGCYGAQQAFVPVAVSPLDAGARVASLRGAGASTVGPQQEVVAQSGSGAPIGLLGAVGALAFAAAGRRPRGAASPLCRQAAAAVEAEAPPPFNPAAQLGITDPIGFFDPLNFSKVGDEEGFRQLRAAELKHGRVAMMAAVGAVVQHYIQLPGFGSVPKGLFAVTSAPGTYGFVALFLISGALELTIWKEDPSKGVDSVGDYGNPLQLGTGQPLGEGEGMKNRELNNGRAAMFAAFGIMVAELVSGRDAMQQLGFS